MPGSSIVTDFAVLPGRASAYLSSGTRLGATGSMSVRLRAIVDGSVRREAFLLNRPADRHVYEISMLRTSLLHHLIHIAHVPP